MVQSSQLHHCETRTIFAIKSIAIWDAVSTDSTRSPARPVTRLMLRIAGFAHFVSCECARRATKGSRPRAVISSSSWSRSSLPSFPRCSPCPQESGPAQRSDCRSISENDFLHRLVFPSRLKHHYTGAICVFLCTWTWRLLLSFLPFSILPLCIRIACFSFLYGRFWLEDRFTLLIRGVTILEYEGGHGGSAHAQYGLQI